MAALIRRPHIEGQAKGSAMTLLDGAIEAHGGLRRWREIDSIVSIEIERLRAT